NSSNDTTNYFISLKHFDMLESGELKDVDSLRSGTVFADSLIRFFPRGVRLTPHSSQVVRVQFVKPKILAGGEYRTHLYILAAEPSKALDIPRSDSNNAI